MCSAISYKTKDHYFGRNLDLEYSYNESVTVTPRNYCFGFEKDKKYALIGMGYVSGGYPLYYDAVNEYGLSMASLSFEGNCVYNDEISGMENVPSFALIPRILRCCKTADEAKRLMGTVNITNRSFSVSLPPTPLHWLIADSHKSITVEQTRAGLRIYDNPVGVLTNNPTFDIQLHNLNNYMHLSPTQPENHFCRALDLHAYSRGMGAIGLPGDLSSQSRFVRAAFTKLNSVSDVSEQASVGQFFHVLESVHQTRGCVDVGGRWEITVYSSCCNTDKGIYYYKTYDNSRINAVDMHRTDLDGEKPISFELLSKQDIKFQN